MIDAEYMHFNSIARMFKMADKRDETSDPVEKYNYQTSVMDAAAAYLDSGYYLIEKDKNGRASSTA